MATLKEILEWAKAIGSMLVILIAVLAGMVAGIEVLVIFSAGHWVWGLFAFACLIVCLYFCARWINSP